MIRNLRPKLGEQGKIKIGRLGEERTTKDGKNTYRLSTKLDHFLITTTERDNTGNFIPNVSLMKEIAEKVAQELGYECIARKVLLEASDEFNISELKLIRAIHDAPSLLGRLSVERKKYIAFVRKEILDHCKK